MNSKILTNMFGTSADLPRIIEIEMRQITANPDQPRKFFDDSSIIQLAQSIEDKGLLQPILVREVNNDHYMIVAGERRYRANDLLGRETIAAIVTDGNMDEIAIIENVQREDLRPIELAESLGRLMQTLNYTQDDMAKTIGKSRSSVAELVSLLRLPDHIKEKCRTSDIASKSFLVELARMHPEAAELAWENLLANGDSSVRSARAIKAPKKSAGTTIHNHFEKVEKSLLGAIKAVQSGSDNINPEDYAKLLEIKNHIDNLLNTQNTYQSSSN